MFEFPFRLDYKRLRVIDSWKGLETLNEYICCCWCFLVWFSSASKTCMWQFSMIHGWSIHIRSLGHTSNAFLIGNLYLIAFEHSIRCIVLIALKTRLKVMFNIMYRHIIIITHTWPLDTLENEINQIFMFGCRVLHFHAYI